MKYEAILKLSGACIAAGLTLFCSIVAVAQNRPVLFVDVNGASTTIVAIDATLRDILEEIAMQSGIIVYSKSSLDMRVSHSIQDKSVPDVIRQILKDQKFTLHYISDAATGLPVFGSRLWIFADDATPATPLWNVGEPAPDWSLRYAAGDSEKNRLSTVSNIATQEDKTGVDLELFAAMNDPSVAVREEAVFGLGELNDPASIRYLKNALYDPDRRVRVAAITALAETANNDAAVALSSLLNDENVSIRSETIHALADIGGNVARYYLQQALGDTNEINRETAAGYLAEFASMKPANRF